MKGDNSHGIRMSALGSRLGSNTKAERQIGHGIDNSALIFVRVVGDSSEAGFEHIVTVEELLLGAWLEPDLVLGVGRQVVESRDIQTEFLGLWEATEARAEADELFARKVGRFFHYVLFAVVHSVSV